LDGEAGFIVENEQKSEQDSEKEFKINLNLIYLILVIILSIVGIATPLYSVIQRDAIQEYRLKKVEDLVDRQIVILTDLQRDMSGVKSRLDMVLEEQRKIK
jgi:hypothetical protein